MPSDVSLAFHRHRVEALSNTLGAWLRCPNASCRRAGACRRADDAFPPCVVTIMRDVNTSLAAYLAALPDAPPRKPTAAEAAWAHIDRINERLGDLLEAEVEAYARKREARTSAT
jgi:hypothetical protein